MTIFSAPMTFKITDPPPLPPMLSESLICLVKRKTKRGRRGWVSWRRDWVHG